MAKIKYMGTSHRHLLKKGDTFGGQLGEGLSKTVEFNRENNWVVDSEDAGLSEEAVETLVKSGDFRDVTELKKIPANEHQKIFLGMKSGEDNEDAPDGDEPRGANLPDGDEPAQGTTETDDTPATTTGGSTSGGRISRSRST